MTVAEMNRLPHRNAIELAAIPQIKLTLINPPAVLRGTVTTVYMPTETVDGWIGFQRMPCTGDFYAEQHFSRENYRTI